MLTRTEENKLCDLEGIIERGLKTFVEVGAALRTIREGKLYRNSYGTFEEYCRQRWGWNASRSRQLISASEVVAQLESVTMVTPTNERQARELAKVEPEQRVEVWESVVSEADGAPITAKKVMEAAKRITAPLAEPDTEAASPDKPRDEWLWQLQNLYTQAPKRSQSRFRKWLRSL